MPYNKYFKYLNGKIKKPRSTAYRHQQIDNKKRLINQETTQNVVSSQTVSFYNNTLFTLIFLK